MPSGDWREHRGRRDEFLGRLALAHAGGDEARLALALARRIPFAFGGEPEAVARELCPLATSLARGVVSERRLAQESGRWVILP